MNQTTPRPNRHKIRVTTRIYFSVAAFLLLFIALGGITRIGMRSTQTQFAEYSRLGSIASSVNSIDRDIEELQRQAVIFSFSGNLSAPERVRSLGQQLQDSIEETLNQARQEETRYHLTQMQEHLGLYLNKFETVVTERQLRTQLVEDEMNTQIKEVETLLQTFIDAPENQESLLKPEVASRLLAETLTAKVSAYQYLTNPDSEQVQQTVSQVNHIIRELAALMEAGTDTEELSRLIELLTGFRQVFVRTVQATRGYLYLVSVVMAGEAAEFAWQSDQVRQIANETLAGSERSTNENHGLIRKRIVWFSVVAFVLSCLVSLMLVRTLVRPISQITSTLVTLTENKEVSSIPALERNDEIGDMARAADVFRQKNQETEALLEQSRKLSQRLEQSNRDLNSFAYVASHDLKSPLRGIANLSSWLVEDVADLIPEESVKHLQQMRQRVRRMETLLDDLLQYSRAGRVPVPLEEVDTGELVQGIRETIDWPEEMTLSVSNPMPHLTTERGTLQRILLNLMTNAVKYRGEEQPHLEITAREQGEFIEFTLTDNGIGIAPKYHERVFEMFQRLQKQSAVEGSGMGLALIKKLIENAGGEISVESEEHKGATFRFTWPKVIPRPEAADSANVA